MSALLDYQITAQIYESVNSIVFRGFRQKDNHAVILKMLKQAYPSPEKIAWFKREYETTKMLDLAGVVDVYSLENDQNRWVIVLEDFGGESLAQTVKNNPLQLLDFWPLAIEIIDILAQVHRQQVIHKDINPSNIVWNLATGKIKLIDFGISTQLSLENPTSSSPNRLEGTLAYISPEQTGRMNRGIDYRTDFYSLGVAFYELLTGQLPFVATDAVELIHAHIAKQPTPLHQLNPEIPEPLSDIVMKLMAKNAEDRYQSAYGIQADLEECYRRWQEGLGVVTVFSLGQQDITDHFQVSQKLYGREAEIGQLLNGFEATRQGQGTRVLVGGYSGIGKSSLVREVYKPIAQQGGYFISGKFDQYQRDIPYDSLVQAFRSLVQQLLIDSEIQIAIWREKLLAALGNNAQVIIEAIPEVELIMGEQPIVAALDPTEAQLRFNQVFQSFVSVFAQPEHPLVLFLDDLQWADAASIRLIEMMMSNLDRQYLYLIGAYRDNEVNQAHPLALMLDKVRTAGGKIDEIHLKPLVLWDVQQLLADTLRRTVEETGPLAELVFAKTHGNPFFINQFLKSLYSEQLLSFDYTQGCWNWDLDQIQKQSITENVVEFMAAKIGRLEVATQEVLKQAACIGSRFDLQTLIAVGHKSPHETALALWPAIAAGLIFPLSGEYKLVELKVQGLAEAVKVDYKFAHDRIQQAAYSLTSKTQQAVLHREIGRHFLVSISSQERSRKIFDIVNQLNVARELLSQLKERQELAQLNLQAGKKAKASAAFQSAYHYFQIGLDLLEEDSWQDSYELTLELHQEAVETGYLSHHFEDAEQLAELVLQRVKSILDTVRIYEIRIPSYMSQGKLLRAIALGREVLTKMGITFPDHPGQEDIAEALAQTKSAWENQDYTELANLPVMSDPEKLAALRLLSRLSVPVYEASPQLYCLIVTKMVDLSVRYGNDVVSAHAYVAYAMVLCGMTLEMEAGYQFGQLALGLVEKLNAKEVQACVLFEAHAFTVGWKKHVRDTFAPCLEAFQVGRETGAFQFAAFGAYTYCLYNFWSGSELKRTVQEIEVYSQAMAQMGQEQVRSYLHHAWQMVLNLLGHSDDPCVMVGAAYNELEMLSVIQEKHDLYAICDLNINKSFLAYLFQRPQQALEYSQIAEQNLHGNLATFTVGVFYFYDSLIRLTLYPEAPEVEQQQILEKVAANQARMQLFASHAPTNFQHKFHLVEAEKARVLGQDSEAREEYDRAIILAQENQYLNEEALAHELAGQFYLSQSKSHVARHYLYDAHYAYQRLGAQAKVRDLEKRYPQLLVQDSKAATISKLTPSTTSSEESSSGVLDLNSVLKAAQTISSEIVLEKLLKNLMKTVIENAGAQKGFLILGGEAGWVIEAEGAVDSDNVTILQSLPIDVLAPSRPTPLLSVAILNYVARTQENIVLNDATQEGPFTRDPYIVTTQPQSILCAPLLHQGQLTGILYLENNLTTGAFTPDRVEVLQILSSQAAISIENSRLYATLEQKVEERTHELSQTLDVLKATQAELRFENDLLRGADDPTSFDYQVGGSLPMGAPTYVVRSADRYLYKSLKQGEFCYILNARQMGKSSLMVRMLQHFQHENYSCAVIDMTRIGSELVTPEQWYKGLAVELWQGFNLFGKVNLKTWWGDRLDLSPVQRLSQFIEEILLGQVGDEDLPASQNLVIFLDEIDSVLGLSFPINDFFALIRSCYNQRSLNPAYRRLSFALFGVATPSDLITDQKRTPFNIGQAVQLEGFKEHEAQPLLYGLSEQISSPQTVLKEVLAWTNGQPFLTQKLFRLIRNVAAPIPTNQEAEWIEMLVQTSIIDNWEAQDEPEHLKTIRDRLLKSEHRPPLQLIQLYQQILNQEEILTAEGPDVDELILSGLVVTQQGHLAVQNRIYAKVFNSDWIRRSLAILSTQS